ncbi:hypothetical protein [Knoellia sp. LjRoot47]|uniref:hypothetical protein n=1 Tax=Knoellia sp. LjRoot47 TaxID=3342330 RepID=UPI003ED01213
MHRWWSALGAAGDVVVLSGLAALIPLLIALYPGPGRRDLALALALALTCYSGTRLAMVLRGPGVRLLQAAFWLFTYVAMGVAPLAQLVLDQYPTPVLGTRSTVATACALTLAGIVAYDVGTHVAGSTSLGAIAEVLDRRRIVPTRLVALALAGIVLAAVLVVLLGGPAAFFTSRQAISGGLRSDSGSNAGPAILRSFGTVPVLVGLLVTTRWLRLDPVRRRQVSVWALWLVLLLANAVVNNPISNPRYWFLTVAFAIMFVAVTPRPPVVRLFMVVAVGAAILLFPFMDRFRYSDGAGPTVEASSWLDPLTIKDYDQMAMFANAISYVAEEGHTWGRQFVGALFFFVPRSVWSGKSHDTGVVLGEYLGTNNTNLSAPLWTEIWIDFAPLGLMAAFFVYGYLSAKVDRAFSASVASRDPMSIAAVVVPVVAGYQFIVLRGSMLQATGRLAVIIITAFVTSVVVAVATSADGAVEGEDPPPGPPVGPPN